MASLISLCQQDMSSRGREDVPISHALIKHPKVAFPQVPDHLSNLSERSNNGCKLEVITFPQEKQRTGMIIADAKMKG